MQRSLVVLVIVSSGALALFALVLLLTPKEPSVSVESRSASIVSGPARSVRFVCSLLNANAKAAGIEGLDGGASAIAGGETIWLFGDTFLGGDRGIVNATIAKSEDGDPSKCIDLRFVVDPNGVARSFIDLDGGETTAWSEGVLSSAGQLLFYYSSVVRDSPQKWHVRGVGVGTIDPVTLHGTRRSTLWDDSTEFGRQVLGARSPLLVGEDLYVFLYTTDNRNLVARAPVQDAADANAYVYWSGSEFSSDPAKAAVLWTETPSPLPRHNGISVMYIPAMRFWLALYAADLNTVVARVASQLVGPWSEPSLIVDCANYVHYRWPACYSAELHPDLTREDGSLLYFTLGVSEPYEVLLFELHLAAAPPP